MRLEQERGFRSSFNFIPEGNYKVPSELRDELVRNGFEVGIHDLKHDGRLFLSGGSLATRPRESTTISASGTRLDLDRASCSTNWTGFTTSIFSMTPPLSTLTHSSRSQKGVTHLSLLGACACGAQSEASSTEADQSAVPDLRQAPRRLRELPYTLPQDFTLFLLLREQTPDIWLQKIDWIASMAGWHSSTCIPIICALMEPRQNNGISIHSLQGAA